jgi:ABC-type branched-subunit amino acid transport system substrate-binding protein
MTKLSMQVLACAFGALGCGAGQPQLTIGSILSQTGMLATTGQGDLLAAQLAHDEIKAAGGIRGDSLVLINADDRSTAVGAATAASTLITRHHVAAIIGAITSDATLAANQVSSAAEVVLISGSSTTPELTGVSPFFFRTVPSDILQGPLVAKRAWAKGFKNVALIWTAGAYGRGLAGTFEQSFTQLGGTISFNRMFMSNQPSYMDLLQQLFVIKPDAILLVAYPVDGAQIIRDYNSVFAFGQTFWFFTDSLQDTSFIDGVGASNFTFMHEGTGAALPSGGAYRSFARAYMNNFGSAPQGDSAQVYDATYLVALALAAASKSDGPAIRDHLRAVADPPGMVVGPGQWGLATAALALGMKINYEGASGSVNLDANGDVVGPYSIWQVRDGVITPIVPSILP